MRAQRGVLTMPQNGSTRQRITRAFPLWLVVLVFVLLCAIAVRAPSIAMPFFADDFVFLEQVRNRSFLAAISAPDQLGHYGRPIGRQVFFWLVAQLGGESPLAFHLANCLLFLASLTLLFALVRRKIGDAPALIAITFLAFHYAVDPLLQWASGSQDLLALLFSLVAIHLYCRNRRWLAAAALALALLSKEVAAATVFIAPAASRPPPNLATGVRKSLPMLAITAAWVLWRYLHGDHPPLHVAWIIPGVIHALQVVTGIEAGQGRPPATLWWVMTALVVVAASVVAWLTRTPSVAYPAPAPRAEPDPTWPLRVGAVWALAGTLVILPALDVWSAYYYVFALCGVALMLAGIISRLRGGLRAAAIVLVITLPSLPRYRESFATPRSPWTWQSHVNGAYLARGTTLVARYLVQLKDRYPHLPPKSTLFFSSVPTASGWQSGDGALMRWAYRDSSLRSYFLSDFTRGTAERGPFFVLSFKGDEIQDWSGAPGHRVRAPPR